MNKSPRLGRPDHAHTVQTHELVALVAFMGIPILAFLVAKLTGVPFYPRYSISCVAGFACLLAIALTRRPVVMVGVLLLLAVQTSVSFVRFVRTPYILEPTTAYELSTSEPQFMKRYDSMLAAQDKDSSIVLLDTLEFAPTFYYAPKDVASRLTYLVWPKDDVSGLAYIRLQKCCNFYGNIVNLSDFLSSHDRFLAYGGPRGGPRLDWRWKYFIDAGATVTIVDVTENDFLVSVMLNKKGVPVPATR